MKLVDRGTVFAGRPKTDAASCAFPSICVTGTGRWLAGFRAAPAKLARSQRAFVSWSDDEGHTWSSPIEPAGPAPELDGKAGSWRTVACTALGGKGLAAALCWEDVSQPLLPMFNEETEGVADMRLFTAVSEEGGERFSKPRPVFRGRYDHLSTPTTGPVLLLANAQWAMPFEVNNQYNDPAPWQHAAVLAFSSDGGQSWGGIVDVHADPNRRVFCWDQRLTLLPDGSVFGLFWTFDRETNAYLNIHARRSVDHGRTWGALFDTGVPGQPARPVGLADGRVAMVYVDRTAAPRIKARISPDGGGTWPASSELLVHERSERPRSQTWDKGSMQDAWAEMSAFSIGLPDAVALPGGDVLAVFYSGDHPDHTDIRWARIKP